MVYTILFMVRYFPFWAIPVSLVLFELGVYHYNRRERIGFIGAFTVSGSLVIGSILWVIFEGYWRAAPFVKKEIFLM